MLHSVGCRLLKQNYPADDENSYYTPIYTESDGKIVQSWERHEIPNEATETDYINALEDLGVSFDE